MTFFLRNPTCGAKSLIFFDSWRLTLISLPCMNIRQKSLFFNEILGKFLLIFLLFRIRKVICLYLNLIWICSTYIITVNYVAIFVIFHVYGPQDPVHTAHNEEMNLETC